MVEYVTYYTHNKHYKPFIIGRHTIRFNELTFLLSGEMTYFINDCRYDLTAGDVIFIGNGSIRERLSGTVANDYISINFHTDTPVELETHQIKCLNNELKLLLNYLDTVHDTEVFDKNNKKVAHIVDAIILQIQDNMSSEEESTLTNTILGFINNHYREKITLQDISNYTFFSPAHCESEFKKKTGRSIIQYLIDVRIEEAKRMLAESSMSCSRIASAVGFEDANYFSRIFKKRTGYSPLRYRDYTSE